MNMPKQIYRHVIVRAVTGGRPALVFNVIDGIALDRICERLVESDRAAAILRAKGYGQAFLSLDEVAALVPDKI